MVEAAPLLDLLNNKGLRAIYLAAGPILLESTLRDCRLDRLYLTLSHQLIGGDRFQTMIPGAWGAGLGHCRLVQQRLIFDASPALRHPQWFAKFECRYEQGAAAA